MIQKPHRNTIKFICVGLQLAVVSMLSETTLEKSKVSFASACQLDIGTQLGMGPHLT